MKVFSFNNKVFFDTIKIYKLIISKQETQKENEIELLKNMIY